MRSLGTWMKGLSAAGCTVLVAATLSHGQSPSSDKPAAKPVPAHKTSHKSRKSRKTVTSHKRGQQKIDSKRAQQIQEALVREHYLSGKPSGVWDDATQKALQKYQADNGWQSKTTPDARALIKLGLGPDHDHLLNPESAMTSPPQAARSMPVTTPAAPPADPPKSQR